MTIDRKRQAYSILRAALDAPVEERDRLITERCGSDHTLRTEIESMLHAKGGKLLDRDAPDIAARLAPTDDELSPGERIGDWQVQRRLGAGGMGVVYLVERQGDGFVQQGALKLVKRGMDSNDVVMRFRRERRILSQLAHPNIARLLDGGIGPSGQPFLVMDFIDGESLADWADRTHADLRSRIAVVLSLCDAVAHAHRQLVIHRDIKPGNVVITNDGQPKLLDFGIARVLADTDADERTATAARFVSRAYAAPEQRTGITTTATDIYQLGLLVFEWLTGLRSPERPDDETGRLPRMSRARALAANAGPKPIRAGELQGDLDVIVARATDPDPARRYSTVEAFADDLRRWRDNLPILARADSFAYRTGRFMRRHRLAVSVGVLAVSAVLIGAGLALSQAYRAEREAQLARRVQGFLVDVFAASAPDAAAGARVTARELLDEGARRIHDELRDQPRLRAEMLLTLGTLYSQLGQFEQAGALLVEARSIWAADGLAPASEKYRLATLELGALDRRRERMDSSTELLDAVLAGPLPAAMHSRALSERAQLRERKGEYAASLTDVRAAATIDRQRGDEGRIDLARDLQIEALILSRTGDFDAANTVFSEALDIATRVLGAEDTRVSQMRNDRTIMLLERSKPVEAEAEIRATLAARRARLGDRHPAIAESLQLLGAALRQLGRIDEAQAAIEEALTIQREVLGNGHGDVANTLNSLAIIALTRHRFSEAERLLRESLSIQETLGLADTSAAATARSNLGAALLRLGRYEEADAQLQRALDLHTRLLGTQHPTVLNDENSLALLALRRGDPVAAEKHARTAMTIADTTFGHSRETAMIYLTLASALLESGQAQAGFDRAGMAIAMLQAAGSGTESRILQGLTVQADALIALGRANDAQALAERILRETPESPPTGRVAAHALMSRVARAQGRRAEADHERGIAQQLLASIDEPDPALRRDVARD